MKKILINGRFFVQRITGTQRFSREIVKALDSFVEKGEFVLAVPKSAKEIDELSTLKNIEVVYFGNHKNNLWDQLDIVSYSKKHNMIIMNLNNNVSLLAPGIATIHDMTYINHKDFHSSLYGKISAKIHELQFNVAAKKSPIIFTVSLKSADEIEKHYRGIARKICVAGNGWEHIKKITPDETILEKYNLKKKKFIFSLGSIEKNKNIKWVYEVARNNPHYNFVISGGTAKNHCEEINPENLENIIFTGYISDGEIVGLYKNCMAFAFPSIYEGFGLPPLEALSLGCEVVCANATCLPEIYKTSVHWFDPYFYNVKIDDILASETNGREEILEKYTWRNMAAIIYNELRNRLN